MIAAEGAQQNRALGGLAPEVRAVISSAFLLRCGQSAAAVATGFYVEHLRRGGDSLDIRIGSWDVGVSIVVAILLSSSYFWELFAAPVFGSLSDRWGRKAFIVGGPLIGLVALWIYPLTGILGILFLARGLEGLAAAALTPATLGFLADNSAGSDAQRGKTMAYFEMATLVGIGSGYALGGVVWQHLGVNSFRSASVLYLASSAVVLIWVSRTRQVKRAAREPFRERLAVLRQPRILRFAPAWLCVTAIVGVWLINVPFQLAGPRRFGQLLSGGMSGTQVSIILGLFTLVLILGTFGWSFLFARIPDKTKIMAVTLWGMFAVCVDLLILNEWGDNLPALVPVLIPILAVGVAIESGFTPAALAYLADITEDFAVHRGAIMGLYSIILSIGEVLGGILGGPFAQAWGINGMVFLTAGLATAAMVTVLLLRRDDARFVSTSRAPSTAPA